MKCKKCGFQNELKFGNAQYCANCGSPLSMKKINNKQIEKNLKKNRRSRQKTNNILNSQNTSAVKRLWIAAAIILGGFLIYSIVDSHAIESDFQGRRFTEMKSENAFIEAKVLDIASKFVCRCQGCNEDPLDKCECDFAKEERQFIREHLEKSNTEDVIIKAVNKKYGGLVPG